MTGIDPAALTSDEVVEAAGEALFRAGLLDDIVDDTSQGRLNQRNARDDAAEAARVSLKAAAAALAAQGTGGDDTGEALKQPKRRLRELLVELGQVPYETPLDGVVMRVNEIIKRGHRIADELHIAAPASSSTQEGRRDAS